MKTRFLDASSLVLALVWAAGLCGCQSLEKKGRTQDAQTGAASSGSMPASASGMGVPHQMVEQDRDGYTYTNTPGKVAPVDAHSVLAVLFAKSPSVLPSSPGPDWKRLENVLEFLNQRAAEWDELNKRVVDVRDTNLDFHGTLIA